MNPTLPTVITVGLIETRDVAERIQNLQIPHARFAGVDVLLEPKNEGHVQINNQWRTQGNEGRINEKQTDARTGHLQFIAQPRTHTKGLTFEIIQYGLNEWVHPEFENTVCFDIPQMIFSRI
jgi:hypothetical protein